MSETAKHSMGPWSFCDVGNWSIHDANGNELLFDSVCGQHPSAKADWYLIAAAPELLAACQGLLNFLNQMEWCAPEADAVANAQTAIAKATGVPNA
jgi:hypothetical protein